jgi:sugar transferase (PEP-CTERM/EpsH1 system associated)
MQILFLANRFPYPPYRGDKLKIYNLAKRLSKNHSLHLVTFLQNPKDIEHLSHLEEIFDTIKLVKLPKYKSILNCILGILGNTPFQVLYFKSAKMKRGLDLFLNKHKEIDVVHVQHLRMSQYLRDNKIPQILDLPDAFSLYWERRLKTKRVWWQRIFDSIESKRVVKYERKITQYKKCLVCSQEDQSHLKKLHNANNINILSNGVDLDTFGTEKHDYSHNHKILFTGNMDYAPNVDGVIYFVQDILPEILKKYPNIEFVIAGQRPVKQVLDLAGANVKITGFIENLAHEYNSASVVVAPLRFGAGTQNKVLEAMACGVPVVCSDIGFEGLGITSGEGAIKETNAQSFAQSVLSLLYSKNKRQDVGVKGRLVIEKNFSWDNISLTLEKYLKEVCK